MKLPTEPKPKPKPNKSRGPITKDLNNTLKQANPKQMHADDAKRGKTYAKELCKIN